jgi:uncharacterized protein (TIGR00266 family)
MKILERSTAAYEIVGDNLEMLKVKVNPQFPVFAEAGKMIYPKGNIDMESRLPEKEGAGILDKMLGAGKRALAGESLFFTYYEGEGEVGFAGDFPGRIMPIGLANQSILAQRDAFIAAMGDVEISIALQKRIGGALFGGEGFIVEKLSGDGIAFIHAGGDLVSFELAPGETMRIDTGSVVAWDESVTYDVAFVGSIKSAIFGGEGIFLTTLTGPGTIIVQTMTLSKLRRMLGVQGSSEDTGSLGKTLGVAAGAAGVGGILGSILGGEDG